MAELDQSRLPLPGGIPGGTPPKTGVTAAELRPRSRPTVLSALSRLTERDLLIADWLAQHGVLTTAQIAGALFTSATTANHRLLQLRDISLIDRFHRPRPGGGFGPWHWVIGALGAQLHAAARDRTPPSPRMLAERHAKLAASSVLQHLLGTNQFFLDLHHRSRHDPHSQLVRWWSERDSTRRYSARIRPDGHALWRSHGHTVGLFLEYDAGTENFATLLRKLAAYDELAADGGPAYPVLFWLHSAHREVNIQAALAEHRTHGLVPVATGVRGLHGGPADTVWLIQGDTRRRVLTELPASHGDPNSMYAPNLNDPSISHLL